MGLGSLTRKGRTREPAFGLVPTEFDVISCSKPLPCPVSIEELGEIAEFAGLAVAVMRWIQFNIENK